MWKTVHEDGGTAGRAQSEAVEIAGRTGTAQSGKPSEPTNAWFTAFAPYENPQLAICVFVENGDSGGRVCAPIARRILEQALGDEEIPIEPMAPAEGHLERIMIVDFDEEEETE